MFLAKIVRRGKPGIYWVLKQTVWDKAERRSKQRYLAGVGASKTIALAKAQAIAQKLGCTVEDLKRTGIRIAEEQLQRRLERRAKSAQ